MKKILTLATIAAASIAVAAVTSENIVGYDHASLNLHFTGIGPMFFNIGEDVVGIQNFECSQADSMGEGYTIAPISQGGSLPAKYYWWCGYSGDGVPDGWYTADSDTIVAAIDTDTVSNYRANVTFDPGQTLVAEMSASGVTMTFKSPLK